MILLLDVVWPLLIGFLLVRAFGRELGILPQLCLGAGLGMGTISCCFFLELETGVPSLLFELLLLAGAGAVCWRTGWRTGGERGPAGAGGVRWLGAALGVTLLGGACGFIGLVVQHPLGGWDAWAIWNLHARFLVTPYWRDLFSDAIRWTHPDYPLLLPGFIARVWSVLGETELTTPKVAAFLFTFGAVGLLGGTVARLKGPRQGVLAALFLAATPFFIQQGSILCADVPVSFFILAALALLALADRNWPETRGVSLLAGIGAGMAAWTKNEGLLLVALVVPVRAVVVWRWRGGRPARTHMAWLAAGLAPVLALVLFFRFTLATSNANLGGRSVGTLLGLLMDPHRWSVMVVELLKHLVRFGGLPVCVPLVLAVYLCYTGVDWKSDRIGLLSGLATLVLALAGYCVVCVLSPYDVRWQTDTALDRLLAQLWPATVFLAFLAARRGDEPESLTGFLPWALTRLRVFAVERRQTLPGKP